MNRGYAFGFLIVLFVVILGLYVAFTGFTASREAQRAQATAPLAAQSELATRPPTRAAASPTATEPAIATSLPGITATLTAVGPLGPAEPTTGAPAEPQATAPGAPVTEPPAATEPPPQAPTNSAAVPTPVSVAAYQFRLAGPAGPDAGNPNCCYIRGTVRDAAGNGLEGVLVQAFNEWNSLPPSATKGAAEAGQYDIPIGRDKVTWYVMIVDAGGKQVSTQVQIQYDPDAAGTYRVDWLRTY